MLSMPTTNLPSMLQLHSQQNRGICTSAMLDTIPVIVCLSEQHCQALVPHELHCYETELCRVFCWFSILCTASDHVMLHCSNFTPPSLGIMLLHLVCHILVLVCRLWPWMLERFHKMQETTLRPGRKPGNFSQTLVHLTSLLHAVALQHLRSDWELANLIPYRTEDPPPPMVQLASPAMHQKLILRLTKTAVPSDCLGQTSPYACGMGLLAFTWLWLTA